MRGAFKNNRKIRILNRHEKDKEGTSRADTTTNLHNFSSRIFLVPAHNLENRSWDGTRPKTQQMPGHRSIITFSKITKSWKSAWTGPIFDFSGWEASILNLKGATIPDQSCGIPPAPQTATKTSNTTIPRPNLPNCPLNLVMNRKGPLRENIIFKHMSRTVVLGFWRCMVPEALDFPVRSLRRLSLYCDRWLETDNWKPNARPILKFFFRLPKSSKNAMKNASCENLWFQIFLIEHLRLISAPAIWCLVSLTVMHFKQHCKHVLNVIMLSCFPEITSTRFPCDKFCDTNTHHSFCLWLWLLSMQPDAIAATLEPMCQGKA